jgi:hypothetical protein
MPAVNDIIKKDDYNVMQSQIANVLGTGGASRGYGQTVRSSQVTESTKVSINEWGNLRYDIVNCYKHIYGTTTPSAITSIVPVTGETITYDPVTEPVGYWTGIASSIDAARLTEVPATQRIMTNQTPTLKQYSGAWGVGATEALRCNVSMSWNTAEEARHWFNSGSFIEFQSYFTKAEDKAQTRSWESFLTTVGAQKFGGNFPGTGTEPNDNQNYFRLNGAYSIPCINISASSPYGSNTFRLYAHSPGVADNSAGTAAQVDFIIEWRDAYTDPPNTGMQAGVFLPEDGVTGTLELSVKTYQAFGSMEPPGTPNFDVSAPTVTIGNIYTSA